MKKISMSISEFSRNADSIIKEIQNDHIELIDHHQPVAYLISAQTYEALLEELDDAYLVELAKKRRNNKSVKVLINQL
jgi:antitoxin StbD